MVNGFILDRHLPLCFAVLVISSVQFLDYCISWKTVASINHQYLLLGVIDCVFKLKRCLFINESIVKSIYHFTLTPVLLPVVVFSLGHLFAVAIWIVKGDLLNGMKCRMASAIL